MNVASPEVIVRTVGILLTSAIVAIPASAQVANGPAGNAAPQFNATDWSALYVRVDEHTDIDVLLTEAIVPKAGVVAAVFQDAFFHRVSAGIPDADIDRILARTRAATGREPVDPRREAYLQLAAGSDLDVGIARLLGQPGVLVARRAMQPSDPGTPGDFQSLQHYQNPAGLGGIGAEVAWSTLGITGEGVSVCDVEYDFDEDHCDLPAVELLGSVPVGVHDHGTAVLGEMVSIENGWGMTGIAHGASGTYFSSWSSGGVSAAIYRAIAGVPEGSIIVIEVHIAGPNATGNGQVGYVPAEWSESTYNAVVAAVSNGMIVVAAAGNGAEDLDDPVYSAGSHAPFLPENDSGAIMVGAGGAYPGCSAHLARLGFSCYGSRVDLQGYGECVATLGYGSLFSESNCDYTSSFSGTSSATPIVAGACMLLQSYAQEAFGRPLTAEEMRSVLVATGQPQTGNTSEHIGPLPDVIAAIDALDITPPCIADLNDDGIVDGFDLSRVLGYWGLPGETDLDGSGSTDGADLTILLSSWGTCPG